MDAALNYHYIQTVDVPSVVTILNNDLDLKSETLMSIILQHPSSEKPNLRYATSTNKEKTNLRYATSRNKEKPNLWYATSRNKTLHSNTQATE